MSLLGPAAMLLSFDIEGAAIAEHDHWHSHEHLPERLAIPGFLRGTRWAAVDGAPRYMVLYEVSALDTLTSDAYLERLNNPTPWTQQMMKHYRGMSRGLCSVVWSEGVGVGGHALLLRFGRGLGHEAAVDGWLDKHVRGSLAGQPGMASAQLLRGAAAARMTNEQQIRGADAGVDHALVLTAYDAVALAEVQRSLAGAKGLAPHGATDVHCALYRLQHSVLRASSPGPHWPTRVG